MSLRLISIPVLVVTMLLCTVSISCGQNKGGQSQGVEPSPLEVSGIIIHKDVTQEGSPVIFSVVADDSPGRYFKNFLKHLPEAGQAKTFPPRALRVSLADDVKKQASDLEDIGVISDKIVVLSETHSKLFSDERVVADYSGIKDLREADGKHGLEGLAVRDHGPGAFRVAVLWEGAHREKKSPRAPRLYLHDITSKDVAEGRAFIATKENGRLVHLKYQDLLSLTGEKDGTVFRAPAMVWTQLPDQKWGFIILLSVDEQQSYHKKWLAQFDDSGKPVGAAVSVKSLGMSQDLAGKNWEGMSWNADQKSFVLVNDAKDGTILFTAAKPTGW